MTDFTPGPWQAETEYDCLDYGFAIIVVDEIRPQIITPTRGIVAFAHAILPEDIDRGRANAALISAAPDLYEAVEICLKAEMERRKKLRPGAPATAYCESRIAKLEAALAKASPGK